ncbi:MAG: hypothetical protein DRR19_24085 [Candidatus Parabeggiatoa sp. nov. 1]|nr:MAG: hypothetical protein DRR19_24085 [Gammaproteobacteria bacterium]
MRKIVVFLIVTLFYSAPCFAAKRFTFVTVDFPPYYGEELPEYGWVSEIARKALEIKGYEVEIRFIPWVKALEGTQEGSYDALLGAYRTPERSQLYYFSLPVGQVRIGFFKRKTDEISFKELTELMDYKIGVVEGYATSPHFDSANYLNKHFVSNLDEGLKLLRNGELDLMADSQAVGEYRLKLLEKEENGISSEIEFIKPELAKNKIYVAISKNATNAARKLMDFNRGLIKIYRKGIVRKIRWKHKKYIK